MRSLIPLCGFLAVCLSFGTVSARAQAIPRQRASFDDGWLFKMGDPEGKPAPLAYADARDFELSGSALFMDANRPIPKRPSGELGGDVAFTKSDFDDSGWRALTLPQDWGVEGQFDQSLPGSTGKLPWAGVGWYRKHFSVDQADAGKKMYLDFDGAMAYALVWVNGHFAGGWPYGYASFRIDVTPYLNVGGANTVAVRLDNPPDSSRWYPGGGIYRNVWLVKNEQVHVAQWGSFVTTPRITGDMALVSVALTLQNDTATAADLLVTTSVYEADSHGTPMGDPVVTSEPSGVKVFGEKQAYCSQTLTVSRPKLWTLEVPQRYVAVSVVQTRDKKIVDSYQTPFGIRKIAFDPDRGFMLNGKVVRLDGVCDHHDLGALGSAINVRALERQIELLKEMGCNAIRTSHNPPAPELLELCDRMGMLVMDESFDCWRIKKRPNDYHLLFDDWSEQDMRALVRRDRNHPCVILWSIGNEVPEQGVPEGWKVAAYLAGVVREEDRTRPITSACNNGASGYNGFEDVLDVLGYNYKGAEYMAFRKRNPAIPLMGSETASAVSSRGEYFFPVVDDKAGGRSNFQVSSYDLYAPKWATPPDSEFKDQDQNPGVAGEFVWTGFDYLGEPTPYNNDSTNLLNFTDPAEAAKMAKDLQALGKISVPSRSSYFGIIDLAGFKKDRFYLYQARWRPDLPMAHLLPHWTWPERVGQVTPVFVYTSGDEAELFLNGQSLGRKKVQPLEYRLRWDNVVYRPGELKVIAYKNGARWAEDSVRTAGAATVLNAKPDRSTISADGSDLSFVTVSIRDKSGVMQPRSQNHLTFAISGPGEIVGVDNGDATNHESFKGKEHDAYNGLCLVIVRSVSGKAGSIVVTAAASGLQSATTTIASTN